MAKNHCAVQCNSCQFWRHIKYFLITPNQYKELPRLENFWCQRCLLSELPNVDLNQSINDDNVFGDNAAVHHNVAELIKIHKGTKSS